MTPPTSKVAPESDAAWTPPWPGTSAAGTARLEYDGLANELPVVVGTEGERAIDIARLRSQTGLITLDEGYVNTGSTASAITFLDGEKGILRYRGYPIEVLAEKCDFVEVAYLLIYGELPTGSCRSRPRPGLATRCRRQTRPTTGWPRSTWPAPRTARGPGGRPAASLRAPPVRPCRSGDRRGDRAGDRVVPGRA